MRRKDAILGSFQLVLMVITVAVGLLDVVGSYGGLDALRGLIGIETSP